MLNLSSGVTLVQAAEDSSCNSSMLKPYRVNWNNCGIR